VQNSSKNRLLEIAVSSVASLEAALEGGADRIELCAALALGGLTPDQAFLEFAVDRCRQGGLPVFVMIRPRAGGFLYDASEVSLMLRSMALARAIGAAGLVSGALLPDGRIDPVTTQRLIDASGDLPFTFHRAFDQSPQPASDLEQLWRIGVNRILTGGGPGPASATGLRTLLQAKEQRLTLVAAGGIRPDSLPPLLALAGLSEFHSAATKPATAANSPPGETTNLSNYPSDYLADPVASADTVRQLKTGLA